MKKAITVVVYVAVGAALVVGAYRAGRLVRELTGLGAPAAWAEEAKKADVTQLVARAERVMDDGEEMGRVYVEETLLFSVETEAGGLTGYERAMIVAKRLNDAFAAGAKPEDFTASVVQGLNAVLWRDRPLITVDDAQARALGKERAQVAEEWAAAIRTAMREALGLPEPQPESGAETDEGGAEAEGEEAASGEWRPPEPYEHKDVVIISVGEGKQLGVARVKGPRSRVRLVQAVAALEVHYKRALEVEIYVPVSTKAPGKGKLARIQGVGVMGIAKYRF